METREWRAIGIGWAVGLVLVAALGQFSLTVPIAATIVAAGTYIFWR